MIPIGILTAPGGSSLDPATVAFNARVVVAGGTLSNNEITAINTLVLSLKSANIWNSLLCIYPMVGASAASCAQNLKSASFTGIFSSGWTFSSNGAKPDGTTAYMETNFNFFTQASMSNAHFSMYSRTQNSSVNGFQLGAKENIGGPEIGLYQYYSVVSVKGGTYIEYPNTAPKINNSNTLGYQIVSRLSTTNARLYFNGSLLNVNTDTQTPGFQVNKTIYLAAMNPPISQPIINYTPHENAFTTFGNGLNDTEANNLYTAVQAFQTTLSRQV
jgi:hypothetical protein